MKGREAVELRTYARIIWRYSWLIAVIVGVVAAYSGYQYYQLRKVAGALTGYSSSISLQIGLLASGKSDTNPADTVTVSEALADTLVSGPILSSREFCADLSQQIGQDMSEILQRYPGVDTRSLQHLDPGALGAVLSAVRVHSLVTISVNWSTPVGAWAIANAVGELSSTRLGQYLDYIVAPDYTHSSTSGPYVQPEVSARIVSNASVAVAVPGTSASKLTLLVLLVVIALVVAIALAFLLDYLDDRIHSKEDIRELFQLPIYGEIPHAPAPGHLPGGERAAL
jgi:capsular polysaccharide biosynthesis protein